MRSDSDYRCGNKGCKGVTFSIQDSRMGRYLGIQRRQCDACGQQWGTFPDSQSDGWVVIKMGKPAIESPLQGPAESAILSV